MLARLFLLFILLPLADLILILMMVRVHWMLTVLWILISGLAGAWYVRRQGLRVMHEARAALSENRIPTEALVEGCLVLVAGGLLITPGLITDVIGMSMLVRPGRRWYRRQIVEWLRRKVRVSVVGADRGNVVEGEVVGSAREYKDRPTESRYQPEATRVEP